MSETTDRDIAECATHALKVIATYDLRDKAMAVRMMQQIAQNVLEVIDELRGKDVRFHFGDGCVNSHTLTGPCKFRWPAEEGTAE